MTDHLSYDSVTDLSFNVSHHEDQTVLDLSKEFLETLTIRKVAKTFIETKLQKWLVPNFTCVCSCFTAFSRMICCSSADL